LRPLKTYLMAGEENEVVVSDEIVISKIYYIRNTKVMLDRDLAELYGVQPKRLREQVKRNIDRFPEKFMFQLTEQETDSKVSQIVIPSRQRARPRSPNQHKSSRDDQQAAGDGFAIEGFPEKDGRENDGDRHAQFVDRRDLAHRTGGKRPEIKDPG
jgi:hypothetical protein